MFGLMSGCNTTHHSAPVIERSPIVKTGTNSKTVVKAALAKADERGSYTVRKGDTLLHIALEFGQNYRDIVAWNNLANPNDIKVDQVLRVLPPEPGTVAAAGVQIGSITSTSNVEVRALSSAPSSSSIVSVTHKVTPRGDKRPYSEVALADLQKSDIGNNTSALPTVAKADTSKNDDVKGNEKSADISSTGVDDEGISWIWPTDGKIVGAFEDGRKGIDIAGKLGQSVFAAGAGKVLYAGSGIRGYGNLVIVKHTNSLLSAYAHNKTIFVKEDQTVNKGQKIAEMGNSDTEIVKLHFEIRQQGKPVDPSKFLPSR